MSAKRIFKKQGNRSILVEDDGDRIYYNFIIGERFDTQPLYDAKFQQNLDEIFITNPSEYYVSVVRFSIPCQNIPIFVPEIQEFPNTNINNTVYSVSLEYNGFTSGETFIQFVSSNPGVYALPISASSPEANTSSIYYWIYNFQAFIDMVNTALATAFTNLSIASGGTLPVGSVAPYFEFDPATQLISLVAQRLFYDQTLLQPINIFMNYKLFVYFDAIEAIYLGTGTNNYLANGKDFQLVIKDLKNNWYNPSFVAPAAPPAYYKMTQNFSNLVSWNVFKSLQISSNMIPIREEYAPSLRDTAGSNTESQTFLKDFEPVLNNGGDSRGILYFVLDGPYQLIDLLSTTPLTKLDLTMYWVDRFGRKYLLQCPYNQVISVKIVFIKKTSYKGDDF